jgi:hypothetical protein
MKKVLATIAGFVFGAFGIAILALLITLTYQALSHIFPDNFISQMWGLVDFDIAMMCWALGFVFQSKSVTQYAAAGTGFLAALVGTLGMVGAEVMLGGQNLVPAQTEQIGQWMIYGFIGVTILHVIMLYTHHGAAPEIWSQIDIGISKSQVTDTARKQATKQIQEETRMLADDLAKDIVAQVKRDLNIPIAVPAGTLFKPETYEQAIPHPTIQPATKDEAIQPSNPFPGQPPE